MTLTNRIHAHLAVLLLAATPAAAGCVSDIPLDSLMNATVRTTTVTRSSRPAPQGPPPTSGSPSAEVIAPASAAPATPAAPAAATRDTMAAIGAPPANPGSLPAPAVQSGLSYLGYHLTGYDDNGDDFLQRGEEVYFYPHIRNTGAARVDGLTGHLRTSDAFLSIPSDGRIYFGTVHPSQTVDSAYVRIKLDRLTPPDHDVTMALELEDRYGNSYSIPLTLPQSQQ